MSALKPDTLPEGAPFAIGAAIGQVLQQGVGVEQFFEHEAHVTQRSTVGRHGGIPKAVQGFVVYSFCIAVWLPLQALSSTFVQ